MLVLDESGSMSSADFTREKNFAISLIKSLMTTTPNGARVGIAQFSSGARLTLQFTDNKMAAIRQRRQFRINVTCTDAAGNAATSATTVSVPEIERALISLS